MENDRLKTFKVALIDGRIETVEAHYFVLDQGAVCFRLRNQTNYPDTLQVFAKDQWRWIRREFPRVLGLHRPDVAEAIVLSPGTPSKFS